MFITFLASPMVGSRSTAPPALRTQWTAHCIAWEKDRSGMPVLGDLRPSPRYVNNYWRDLRGRSPGLSLLAEYQWEAAVSSSQSERAFSMLTTMDVPNRRTMEELTLANTLFLRAKTTWTRLHRSCRQNRSEDILTCHRAFR